MAALGGLFYFLFLSSAFQITEIEISGNKKVQEHDIRKVVDDYIGRHFLLFWKPRNSLLASVDFMTQKLLSEQFLLEDVVISKEYPNKIIINVKERRVFGIWCAIEFPVADNIDMIINNASSDPVQINSSYVTDKCYYIDHGGMAFNEAPESTGSLILVIKESGVHNADLGDKVLNQDLIDSIREIQSLISDRDLRVVEFLVTNKLSGDIEVVMSEGWKVYFNIDHDLGGQIDFLDKALHEKISAEDRENLEYIDLRIPDRIYYK